MYLKKTQILLILVLGMILLSGCTNHQPVTDTTPETPVADPVTVESSFGAAGALSDQSLTLENMLNYAIEDEYLAHQEYVQIMDAFGSQKPFSNIIKAEESHISELVGLFDAYHFSVPDDQSKDHVVLPASIEESLKTGVQAEINNIAMYEKFLEEDLPADVQSAFEHLRDGSKNHLAAFQKKQ